MLILLYHQLTTPSAAVHNAHHYRSSALLRFSLARLFSASWRLPAAQTDELHEQDGNGVTRISKMDPNEGGTKPRDPKTYLLLSGVNHNLFGTRDPKA